MANIKKLTVLHSNDLHGDFLAVRYWMSIYLAIRTWIILSAED